MHAPLLAGQPERLSRRRDENPVFFTGITTFDALPGGKTSYIARTLHWTLENRIKHEQMGFHQGWGESLDRLVAFVTQS